MRPLDYTLYLVTDQALAGGRPLLEVVRRAIDGGVTIVQLREKRAETRDFLALALEARRLLDPLGIPLIINDRIDVALACGAAGVHLGQSDIPCAAARGLVGDRMIIGISVDSIEQAIKAEAEGADYLAVSSVFSTPTKPDVEAAVGLDGLSAIRRATRLPLVAIGGINAKNAAAVAAAGADGIAVVSAIMAAQDPGAAAAELLAAFRSGRRPL